MVARHNGHRDAHWQNVSATSDSSHLNLVLHDSSLTSAPSSLLYGARTWTYIDGWSSTPHVEFHIGNHKMYVNFYPMS